MAESQPLLGSKSLKVHERGQCTSLYPTIAEDIYQPSTNPCGNHQEGGGPRYQQGGSQPQQLGGSAPGQPPSSASGIQLQYKLETFTETRVIRNVSEPYEGQPITLFATRTTPDPWNISVNPTSLFKNSQTEVEIPNTSSIETCYEICYPRLECCRSSTLKDESVLLMNCHECYGKGFHRCNSCNGNGGDECWMCNGGTTGDGNCSSCGGTGRRSCSGCHGNGNKKCSTCNGTTKVKRFTKMIVTRINNTDIVSGEGTGIPLELIKHAIGRVVFKKELPRVSPITHFQDEAINNASRRLIAKHGSNPKEKIIKQRHSVNLVPISEIRCQYEGTMIHYFVFGFDNQVYAPDYPAQCCCTVL